MILAERGSLAAPLLLKNKKMLAFYHKVVYYTLCALKQAHTYGPLAQLVEHLTLNQGVQGSNP